MTTLRRRTRIPATITTTNREHVHPDQATMIHEPLGVRGIHPPHPRGFILLRVGPRHISSYFADRFPGGVSLPVYALTKSALTAFTNGLAQVTFAGLPTAAACQGWQGSNSQHPDDLHLHQCGCQLEAPSRRRGPGTGGRRLIYISARRLPFSSLSWTFVTSARSTGWPSLASAA